MSGERMTRTWSCGSFTRSVSAATNPAVPPPRTITRRTISVHHSRLTKRCDRVAHVDAFARGHAVGVAAIAPCLQFCRRDGIGAQMGNFHSDEHGEIAFQTEGIEFRHDDALHERAGPVFPIPFHHLYRTGEI